MSIASKLVYHVTKILVMCTFAHATKILVACRLVKHVTKTQVT